MAFPRALGGNAKAVAGGEFGGEGVQRYQQHAGQAAAGGQSFQHLGQHHLGQLVALRRVQRTGQALLGAGQLLHRHNRPGLHHSAASTARASATLTSSVFISVGARTTCAAMPLASSAASIT